MTYKEGAGAASTKEEADCSGAIHAIYEEAGLPYPYSNTAGFDKNPAFEKLGPGEEPQPGYVGVVRGILDGEPGGHMFVYDPGAIDSNGKPANSWSKETKRDGIQARDYKEWEKKYGSKTQWYRYKGL